MKIPYECQELTEEQKKVLLANFPPPRQHLSYFNEEFIEVIHSQNMSLKDNFSSTISSVKNVPLSVMPAYDMVQYDVYNSARGRPVFPRRCEGHML